MTRIKEIREQKGLSQQQLSEKSGVPQQTISSLESGIRKNPRIDTAQMIADALGCTIDELFSEPTKKDA